MIGTPEINVAANRKVIEDWMQAKTASGAMVKDDEYKKFVPEQRLAYRDQFDEIIPAVLRLAYAEMTPAGRSLCAEVFDRWSIFDQDVN